MSNLNPSQLTAWTGAIDIANDLVMVWKNSNSTLYKATPNQLANLTSQLVGRTDTQTLTNKTLTSPTISAPVLSGTVTGTYTLGGTPTFPAAVVTLTGSQTLTNKILTSPTINAPTITNATITADSLTGFTVANTGTVYGLSITGGTLGTGAVTAGSIAAGAVVPNSLVASSGASWPWQAWTPSWTSAGSNPTLGNGAMTGFYQQIGKTVHFRMTWTPGSTTTFGTGDYHFSLPVTAKTPAAAEDLVGIGGGHLSKAGVANFIAFPVLRGGSATVFDITYVYYDSGLGYNVLRTVQNSVPATWANGDIMNFTGTYEAA